MHAIYHAHLAHGDAGSNDCVVSASGIAPSVAFPVPLHYVLLVISPDGSGAGLIGDPVLLTMNPRDPTPCRHERPSPHDESLLPLVRILNPNPTATGSKRRRRLGVATDEAVQLTRRPPKERS